jgi:enoyl-CoA hydratase/carnithine racemase
MSYENIILDKRDGYAVITLNRPEALNALSPDLWVDLQDAVARVGSDESIRALIITGAGRAFSAGNDIKQIQQRRPNTDLRASLQVDTLRAIEDLPIPVIAAVHGHCITGALELVLYADIVIAADNARFWDTHAKWGLTHTWGGIVRLPDRVGRQKARELMFVNEPIGADEALRIGLANQVVPADELLIAAEAMARKIGENSRETIRIVKGIMNDTERARDAEGDRLTRERSIGMTADAAARLADFGKR